MMKSCVYVYSSLDGYVVNCFLILCFTLSLYLYFLNLDSTSHYFLCSASFCPLSYSQTLFFYRSPYPYTCVVSFFSPVVIKLCACLFLFKPGEKERQPNKQTDRDRESNLYLLSSHILIFKPH